MIFRYLYILLFYAQRLIKTYQLRDYIAMFEAKFFIKYISIRGNSKLVKKDKESFYSDKLSIDGAIVLDEILNVNVVHSIINKTRKLKLYDPFKNNNKSFNFNKIPLDAHVGNFFRHDLIKISEIMDIANDPGILRIVGMFLGASPTISNINMWWSLSDREKPKNAQLFHRDVDDIKFCKLFIYLTDVNKLNGPHIYVKKSANSNRLTKIRRYDDKEIEKVFGNKNIVTFTGEKGSCFLVNTYGFHKGLLPIESNRLLLQVQYSINRIGIENYCQQDISNANYDKYINRLLIK